ncbi:cAMP-dependent protein kinase type II-alpha regulatory subunit, putative [Pediculus humanus corporis]|uniref:cAMP-dependent protein kinase type II-alpha regulatory subunit, putative n=1 Tax=Pediculus humanus subsp. corporis TaxID=121224 RepID=E0VRT6_PEDHC|nr:cAMP-dependent protein kinase type II-alpha regulatory subunit, putative [Pediculus humanus corporis]EEB16092.1 cAMP-dependent protein kinase type II-alpha regulatory subunit, putative [Pediculus humanus corporis]
MRKIKEVVTGKYTDRRKSVFAEAYDPEEDEDDGERIVFPKSDEQRKRLADSIQNILLFKSLDKEQMQEILDAMFERQVQPEEWIIHQGEDGDNFYVIERGIFNAYVLRENEAEPMHVHTYEDFGSFGELALLYNMPRAASVKAVTEGSLWAMDRLTFRRIILKSAFKKRKMYEQLLESVPMLKALQTLVGVVLDVEAFERLLGPCMQIMKRNINDYEEQLIKIFGSKNNITDIR